MFPKESRPPFDQGAAQQQPPTILGPDEPILLSLGAPRLTNYGVFAPPSFCERPLLSVLVHTLDSVPYPDRAWSADDRRKGWAPMPSALTLLHVDTQRVEYRGGTVGVGALEESLRRCDELGLRAFGYYTYWTPFESAPNGYILAVVERVHPHERRARHLELGRLLGIDEELIFVPKSGDRAHVVPWPMKPASVRKGATL